jgi:predicted TIM-barrel fold metal-dependent hydrolase
MRIINFHVHPTSQLQRIRRDLASLGIGNAVLLPVDMKPPPLLDYSLVSGYGLSMDEFKFLIKYMGEIVKGWPEHMVDNWKLQREISRESLGDFFIPFSSIDPGMGPRYIEEKIEELHQLGSRGIFLSPALQLFDPGGQGFSRLIDHAEGMGLVIVLHIPLLEEPLAEFSRKLIEDSMRILHGRRIRLVISGVGTDPARADSWLSRISKHLRRIDEAFVDTADLACALLSNRRALNQLGAERLIFGSRYPCRSLEWLRSEIRCIASSGLEDVDVEMILRNNALDLLSN